MTDTSVLMEPFVDQLLHVPFALAPEKSGKLADIVFHGRTWKFKAIKGSPASKVQHFGSNPDEGYLWVTYAGLASVWCVSLYAALLVRIINAFGGHHHGPTNIGQYLSDAQKYLVYAEGLRLNDFNWPSELSPVPSVTDPLVTDVNNVFFAAAGLILLHEIAHISKKHKIHLPEDLKIVQENEADTFAASWIFEGVNDPAQREFRILATGIAMTWLLMVEPPGGSPEHPPAHFRVRAMSEQFNAHPDSPALEIVSHLMKATLFPRETPPTFSNSTALFAWTIERLRQLSA
jgi:hypothetical protein